MFPIKNCRDFRKKQESRLMICNIKPVSYTHLDVYKRQYMSRSYVGNGWVVNFADASAQGGGDPLLIYRYGKAVNSDEMMHFAAYLLNGRKPYATMGNDAFRSLQSLLCCNELAKACLLYTSHLRTPFCVLSYICSTGKTA